MLSLIDEMKCGCGVVDGVDFVTFELVEFSAVVTLRITINAEKNNSNFIADLFFLFTCSWDCLEFFHRFIYLFCSSSQRWDSFFFLLNTWSREIFICKFNQLDRARDHAQLHVKNRYDSEFEWNMQLTTPTTHVQLSNFFLLPTWKAWRERELLLLLKMRVFFSSMIQYPSSRTIEGRWEVDNAMLMSRCCGALKTP